MVASAGPFDTGPAVQAMAARTRAWDRAALNFFARSSLGPWPELVQGFRINVESYTWLTVYFRAWNSGGVGNGTSRLRLRVFDLDDATMLLDRTQNVAAVPLALVPGNYRVEDYWINPPLIAAQAGHVYRVVAVVFEIVDSGGLVEVTMDAKALARLGRRGPE